MAQLLVRGRFELIRPKSRRLDLGLMVTALGLAVSAVSCGFSFAPTPAGAVVGRPDIYDYSPSVLQDGDVQQFWWCGQSANPNNTSQNSDTILYESVNVSTHARYGPLTVLGETPGGWDSAYTCNPRVVRGVFDNPFGDGQSYTYAMYYVGTASMSGINNSIGVAFSNNGINWRKYPKPVIASTTQTGYGPAQPVAYNADHKSAITLFYENSTAPTNHHVEATSTDGINFTTQGTLTTNGLDPHNPLASWGDMAYDSSSGYWYAVFNLPVRNKSTTGNIGEWGQYGVELYRIPNAALLTGNTPWQYLKTFDTNLTGFESNFIPGLLRDGYGNVNVGQYPSIQIFTSISNPQPRWDASSADASQSAATSRWDISTAVWVPNNPLMPFNRYVNGAVHEVTSGWIDPQGGFKLELTLGHLYESPQQGATVALYGCKDGSTDYFVSLDSACEGKRILGVDGYAYSSPVRGLNLIALYRCASDHDHFVSTDPNCEGQTREEELGYILP
jgi:hypothetical protein